MDQLSLKTSNKAKARSHPGAEVRKIVFLTILVKTKRLATQEI